MGLMHPVILHVYVYVHDTMLVALNTVTAPKKLRLTVQLYTCQLFLRYKREIFILGVLGFLKMTRSFPKIPEEFRSLPKKSEVFRRRPKSAEGEVIESQS